jgi:hypothetical protein
MGRPAKATAGAGSLPRCSRASERAEGSTDIVYLTAKVIGSDGMSGTAMPIWLNLAEYIALP